MDCRNFVDRYSDYDDSLLSAAELAIFREHLSRCRSCERYDRVLRKGRMLARQLPRPEPGADFVPRLQDRLRQFRDDRRRRHAAPVLGGAAVALAAVTVVVSSMVALSILDQRPAAGALADSPLAELEAVPAPAAIERARAILPVAEPAPAREWAALRVDPRVPVSYSPLVIGPPVYRTAGGFPTGATATPQTLD